jgi:hypothetical protein
VMPNRPAYGDLAFGSSGVPPNYTYRIAPAVGVLDRQPTTGSTRSR